MKRSIVICFSSKADGSDLPARYIPKKQRDVNQNQCSSLGDSVLQVGIQTRSTSSNDELGHKTLDRIKRPRGCKIDDEEFLVNIDDANGNPFTIFLDFFKSSFAQVPLLSPWEKTAATRMRLWKRLQNKYKGVIT